MKDPVPAEKFVGVGGIRTRYLEAGTGEPLVLFHGGNMGSRNLAECAEDWEPNIPGLARHFRVIAVDKLGQGYTDNPPADADYTMTATVRHAHEFLRTLGLRDVNIAGHSRGGYLVAGRQSRAQMCVLNRAGHFCFREQPAAFNTAVAGFVKGL